MSDIIFCTAIQEDYEGGGLRATKYLQDVKIKLIGGLNCRSQKLLKPSSTLCAAGSQKSQHNSQLKVEEIYNYVTTVCVHSLAPVTFHIYK
jgi:hypothetical protein